MVTVYWAYK